MTQHCDKSLILYKKSSYKFYLCYVLEKKTSIIYLDISLIHLSRLFDISNLWK